MTDSAPPARDSLTGWLNDETDLCRRFLRKLVFADGDILFQQGDVAHGAFFIQQGEVELSVALPGGGGSDLAVLGPGEILGEVSLISDSTRSATARARGAVHAWCMDRRDLQAICSHFDTASFEFLRRIAVTLARRIHSTDDRALQLLGVDDSPPSVVPLGTELRWLDGGERGARFDPEPFMSRLPFFTDFSDDDRRALLDLGKIWSLPRKHVLFQGAEPSHFIVVVLRGAVAMCAGPELESLVLLGPGTVAGACSVLSGRPRHASCIAREATTLLRIELEQFNALMVPNHRVEFRFLAAITRDLLHRQLRATRTLARIEQQRLVEVRKYHPHCSKQ